MSADPHVLVGELDVATEDALGRQLPSYAAEGTGDVVLDCAAVTFVDSSGLRTLVVLSKELRESRRSLRLVNVPPLFRRTLEITGLVKLFGIDPFTQSDG